MVPCLDVVRVVLRRARNGKQLFLPDKTHIHHKFLAMGFSPRRALVTIQLMSALFVHLPSLPSTSWTIHWFLLSMSWYGQG